MRRASVLLVLGTLALAGPDSAEAQAPPPTSVDATTRARARQLGEEGLELYDGGDYGAALAKLEAAERLVEAPTLGLFAARCLVRLGRPVEAAERYLAVINAPLPQGASSVLRKAREAAEVERAELLPRIPRLRVVVEGPGAADAAIEIDGARVDAARVAAERPTDPGSHDIVAVSGKRRAERRIVLDPGEVEHVVLQLPAEPTARAPDPAPDRGSSAVLPQRTLGWIAIGVGGASMSVWSVAGAVALRRATTLECDGGTCAAGPDDVDGLNTARTVSMIGFWAGITALGAGAILVLTAPPRPTTGAPTSVRRDARSDPGATRAWIGPGSIGVQRTF